MKTKFITLSVLLISALSANAQLEVKNTGAVQMSKNVAVNGAELVDSISLNIETPNGSADRKFGIYSFTQVIPAPLMGSGCNVSVYGEVATQQLRFDPSLPSITDVPFQAGVAGVATRGIGVYGGTSSPLPTSFSGTYAGYFSGNVKVTGSVTATTVNTTSDIRLKDNISKIDNDVTKNILLQLHPVTYRFKNDSNILFSEEDFTIAHYGLIAQELQKVLPELVHEECNGYLSVNYIELIPLLINALQNQQQQIDELNEILEGLSLTNAPSARKAHKQNYNEETIEAILYQNNPNPFDKQTVINYQIPSSAQHAVLCIYNMNGLQLAEYPISSNGVGSITIDARHLDAGMYLYTLIVDGKAVDTKRMILTN